MLRRIPKPVQEKEMKQTDGCGLCGIYPKWLRAHSNSRTFLLVYGLLGMVQAMAFIYIVVTLTTLEKRFKIPSRTTGVILSGNEISQILSLGLIYYGGAGHRPRWLATGVGLSAISCFVLALPHVIYGPGKDALALTQEYLNSSMLNSTKTKVSTSELRLCIDDPPDDKCDVTDLEDSVMLPRFLVFLSQFILGVGTTLYFGLGQTYLDDNTNKKDTPLLLGCTYALRTVGPVLGFVLGFACLNFYINPSLHPIIDQQDPRWLGAWWLGWIFLGTLLAVFTCLIAMFPRELSKPFVDQTENQTEFGGEPLKLEMQLNSSPTKEPSREVPKVVAVTEEEEEEVFQPTISDFPISMRRLFSNKILMINSVSAICIILGIVPYITFLPKYLEVQFGTSAAGGSVITGTVSLVGMVLGFLISGFVISKFKPSASKLLGWNVFVALFYFFIALSFAFVSCDGPQIQGVDIENSSINFTTGCNAGCNCDGVKYAPVCHEASMITFYSACHAGCSTIINGRDYGNCSCVNTLFENFQSNKISGFGIMENLEIEAFNISNFVKAGPCPSDCTRAYFIYAALSTVTHILASSGRIGNVLVNYRCVDKNDKSFAQGVTLMMISLFALIPGPILFGALIDSTCLIWDESCGSRGNCWYYDKEKFRYIVNYVAAAFTFVGAIFDGVVCYLVRDLDLYGLNDDKRREFVKDIMLAPESSEIEANGKPVIVDQIDQVNEEIQFVDNRNS